MLLHYDCSICFIYLLLLLAESCFVAGLFTHNECSDARELPVRLV